MISAGFFVCGLPVDLIGDKEFFAVVIDHQRRVGLHLVGDDHAADQGLHLPLEEALQRTGAVDGIVALIHNVVLGCISEGYIQLLLFQTLAEILHQQIHDGEDVLPGKGFIEDDLV